MRDRLESSVSGSLARQNAIEVFSVDHNRTFVLERKLSQLEFENSELKQKTEKQEEEIK